MKVKMDTLYIVLRIVALTYIGLMLFAYFLSDRMIFPAPPPNYTKELDHLLTIKTADYEIAAVHKVHPNNEYTILYSHGNGEDLGTNESLFNDYVTKGYNLFAYDYPGYGLTAGKPSERGTYASAEAAYKYLTETLDISPEKIILYGRSLGGGPSTHLANKYKVGGVILECTFASIFRVPFPINPLPWDKFDNLSKIKDINAPLLILHGKLDRTVPFSHGVKLYEAANEPKQSVWLDDAGHNDILHIMGERYWETLDSFVNSFKKD